MKILVNHRNILEKVQRFIKTNLPEYLIQFKATPLKDVLIGNDYQSISNPSPFILVYPSSTALDEEEQGICTIIFTVAIGVFIKGLDKDKIDKDILDYSSALLSLFANNDRIQESIEDTDIYDMKISSEIDMPFSASANTKSFVTFLDIVMKEEFEQ